MLRAGLLIVAALPGAAGPHPESLSRSKIEVHGASVSVEVRFQALSMIEALPRIERQGDRVLDADELRDGRDAIAAYLQREFRLARVVDGTEEPLAGRLESLVADDPGPLGPFDLQWATARLAFEAPAPIEVLVVECTAFRETNPWHRDFAALSWNDDEPVPFLFHGPDSRWLFEPAHVRRPGVLAMYLGLGVDHIRTGFDHIAFLLALLVASASVRGVLLVVTAFTLAHSLTLAAAALGWVDVSPRLVELAIALSIAYVGCDNLLRREPRTPWLEAFGFGLLHGLGFAGFLADSLAGEPLVLTALLGFNLGVEVGQVAIVAVVLAAFGLAFRGRWRRPEAGGLVPGRFRTAVSAVVAAAGFWWFLERAGWLPS